MVLRGARTATATLKVMAMMLALALALQLHVHPAAAQGAQAAAESGSCLAHDCACASANDGKGLDESRRHLVADDLASVTGPNGHLAGASVLIQRGDEKWFEAAGFADVAAGTRMQESTVFRVCSMVNEQACDCRGHHEAC